MHFFLEQPRTFTATVPMPTRSAENVPRDLKPTVVLMLSRQQMARLEDEHPDAAALLSRAIIRSLCDQIGSGVLESIAGLELATE